MLTRNDIGRMVEPDTGQTTYGWDVKQMIGWEDDTDLPILITRNGVKHNCFPEDYTPVNIQFDQVPEQYRCNSYPNNRRPVKSKSTPKAKVDIDKPKTNHNVSNKDLMFALINKDK